jgi:hypothetical protein
MKFYYAYILQSRKDPNRFHVESTEDFKERPTEHNSGKSIHARALRPWRINTCIAFRASDFVRHLIDVSNINRLKVVQTFLKQLRVDPNATQPIEGHPFHIHLIGIPRFPVLGFRSGHKIALEIQFHLMNIAVRLGKLMVLSDAFSHQAQRSDRNRYACLLEAFPAQRGEHVLTGVLPSSGEHVPEAVLINVLDEEYMAVTDYDRFDRVANWLHTISQP